MKHTATMAAKQPPPFLDIYPKDTPVAYLTDVATSHARTVPAADRDAADGLQDATRNSMTSSDGDGGDASDDAGADAVPALLPPVDINGG